MKELDEKIGWLTAQKIKFSIKDFFYGFGQLLKKSLMKKFIFCAVSHPIFSSNFIAVTLLQ